MAALAYNQLKDISDIQKHRINISRFYEKELEGVEGVEILGKFSIPPLRYPILVRERDQLYTSLLKLKIQLGDWYSQPVSPLEVSNDVSHYKGGDCPTSEKVASMIINLPTHINISIEDANRITDEIKFFFQSE